MKAKIDEVLYESEHGGEYRMIELDRGDHETEITIKVCGCHDETEPFAFFIAEAFNVYAETRRTSRQLVDERGGLLAALNGLRSEIVRNLCASYEPDTVVGMAEIVQADAAIADAEAAK